MYEMSRCAGWVKNSQTGSSASQRCCFQTRKLEITQTTASSNKNIHQDDFAVEGKLEKQPPVVGKILNIDIEKVA